MASHKNHQSKEYKLMRAVCFWLHDFKCFICKKTCDDLECHHINKISCDNHLDNLMPVCPACHKLIGMIAKFRLFTKSYIVSLIKKKKKQYEKLLF